jgi:hypothetical protein
MDPEPILRAQASLLAAEKCDGVSRRAETRRHSNRSADRQPGSCVESEIAELFAQFLAAGEFAARGY